MHEGLVLADRFSLVRKIGQGGMGAVWEGRDTMLGRRVAIKTLAVSPTQDAVRRFRAEAQIGAGLSHPGIMVVHDIGQYEQTLYLVMEYLEGSDLKTLMERGPIPLERSLRIAAELLGALGAAHAQGVVHRDVKPGNVMVLDQGGLKILDFGIARFTDATLTGSIVGTPAYMAPEQFTGTVEVDGRCDLYSFGVLLYELATGRPPFDCSTLPEFVHAHLQQTPEPPRALRPDLPESLNRLILDLLAKDPANRPATAEATLRRLEFVRAGLAQGPSQTFGTLPPPHTPPPQTPPPFSGRPSPGPATPPPADLPFAPPTPSSYAQPSVQHTYGHPGQGPGMGHGPGAPGPGPGGPGVGWAPTQPPYQQAPPPPGYHQPYGPGHGVPEAPGAHGVLYMRRFGAFVVDWMIAFFAAIMFTVLITWNDPEDADLTDQQGVAMLTIWALVYVGFGMMEGLLGFSPGKGLFLLRVVHARTGERLGILRGVARVFAQVVNWWTLLVGYLNPLWDKERQTFADKICGARVVRA